MIRITLPYPDLDWIYEGIEPPYEKATGPVFNRTPRQLLDNQKYLLNWINSIASTQATLVGSPDSEHMTDVSYMKDSLVTKNGVIYISKLNNNLNHPVTDSNWWSIYNPSNGVAIGVKPALATPVLNYPSTSKTSQNITISVANIDSNATSYQWTISGTYTLVSGTLNGTSTTIVIRKDTEGSLAVTARAIANGTDYVSSNVSATANISVSTSALAVPNITGLTSITSGENVTYTITNHSVNVSSYNWNIKGAYQVVTGSLTGSNSNTITIKATRAGTLKISAKAIGDGVTYADSGVSTPITVTAANNVLTTPTISASTNSVTVGDTVTFTLSNTDFNMSSVTWVVTGGYTVQTGSLTGSTNTSITLVATTPGTLSVKAKLEGDDNIYIDSNYTTNVNVVVSEGASSPTTYSNSIPQGGGYSNGITYTDPYSIGAMYFNAVTFDNSVPALIMFGTVGGQLFKLDYAGEYNGNVFEIERNGVRYTGIFTENSNSGNPEVLTQA